MVGNNFYFEILSVSERLNNIIDAFPVMVTEMRDSAAQPGYCSSLSYESFTARLIAERRQRVKSFAPELFADPAWDMLLDLFLAMLRRKHISISSACIASSVPPTTGLRWLTHMCESGIFIRTGDHTDRRKSYVQLSDATFQQMVTYLDTIAENSGISLMPL